jgi:hypothetical protein
MMLDSSLTVCSFFESDVLKLESCFVKTVRFVVTDCWSRVSIFVMLFIIDRSS